MRTLPLVLLPITFVLSLLVSTLLAAKDAGEPPYPPAGLDMSATDPSTRPGDDFHQFANGAWLARMTIPDDRPLVMEWQVMRDRTETQLRGLVETAAASARHEPTTIERKWGLFTSPSWIRRGLKH